MQRTTHRQRSVGRGRLFCEQLERRILLAYDLVHSLFPDPDGPEVGSSFGRSVAVTADYRFIGTPAVDMDGVTESGQVFIYDSSDALVATLDNPTAATFDQFGHSVAASDDILAVSAPYDDTGAQDAGSVYVYDLSSGSAVLQATLHNPTPGNFERFGWSVAVSGYTVVVGTPHDDTGAGDAGIAYVYSLSSGTAELQATLHNPDPGFRDEFGSAVAVSGNTVVVGAREEDAGPSEAGDAYVFELSNGGATLQATLNNPNPTSGDHFGSSVAVSGDTVVVGAPIDDTGAGRAYVYDLSNSPAMLQSTLNNPTPAGGDRFGGSVAVSANSIVVGAPGDDLGADSAGVAHVYDLSTGIATLQTTLVNPTSGGGDQFGNSVALSGNTVVVGAYQSDAGAEDAGIAHVYELLVGTAVLRATLDNPSPAFGDLFGSSVALSGNTVAVTATDDDTGARNAGSTYIYDISGGTAVLQTTIPHPEPARFDRLGRSVAVSGNTVVLGTGAHNTATGIAYVYELSGSVAVLQATLDNPSPGDGFDFFGDAVAVDGDTVVVGAYGGESVVRDDGIAYVYDLSNGTPQLQSTLKNPAPTPNDRFGRSVAISGDRVVVGAYGDDMGGSDSGIAYVYNLSGGTAVLESTLTSPSPASGDWFGWSVAVSGDRVVVGAHQDDDSGAVNSGSAYVYDLSSGSAVLEVALHNPAPEDFEFFGRSVATSGDLVVVGASHDHQEANEAGSAYVYDLSSGTAVLQDTFNNPTPASADRFGWSVAVSGDTVLVGAHQDDTQNLDQGAAYVFRQPITGDFNDDRQLDCADIDGLTTAIASLANDPQFDLNGDSIVDTLDRDIWLTLAGELNLGPGQAYLLGDVNLDGHVNALDFLVWNINKFTASARWCEGDLTADGVVNGPDFVIWNDHKFMNSAPIAWETAASTQETRSNVVNPCSSTEGAGVSRQADVKTLTSLRARQVPASPRTATSSSPIDDRQSTVALKDAQFAGTSTLRGLIAWLSQDCDNDLRTHPQRGLDLE